MLAPSAGTILLEGEDITRLAAHRRVERGLVRTFQINQLFGELTPVQSLALAVSGRLGQSAGWWRPLGGGQRSPRRRALRPAARRSSTSTT